MHTRVNVAIVLVCAAAHLACVPQQTAETKAGRFWGRHYRQDARLGAAWVDPENGKCYVGVCDGTADKPGFHREVVGEPGAYYNLSWDARFKSPAGRYYKNVVWFGYGATWDEAFKAAGRNGYPDCRPKD